LYAFVSLIPLTIGANDFANTGFLAIILDIGVPKLSIATSTYVDK
jgi:hypothetical protein